jgi:hypothetical protein
MNKWVWWVEGLAYGGARPSGDRLPNVQWGSSGNVMVARVAVGVCGGGAGRFTEWAVGSLAFAMGPLGSHQRNLIWMRRKTLAPQRERDNEGDNPSVAGPGACTHRAPRRETAARRTRPSLFRPLPPA